MVSNDWCRILETETPKLEQVVGHREANTFALLLVALLERGAPMTLAEVAARLAEVGYGGEAWVLRSLQRCKPGRPPLYREGERYHLDPHAREAGFWVRRLDLRPPPEKLPRRAAEPVPGPEVPLSEDDLDEAFTNAGIYAWSVRRLALAVLEASGGPRAPAEIIAAIARRTKHHALAPDPAKLRPTGAPLVVLSDGRWAIGEGADEALQAVRGAVRKRVAEARARAAKLPDPARVAEQRAEAARAQAAHQAARAAMSRALVVAFPPRRPQAAALLDVEKREISTFVGEELRELRARLAHYAIIGAIEVRALLDALGVEPGDRELAELGPAQKSKRLNRSGRTLKITTALLIQGSCNISRPFGDPEKLAEYLAEGDLTKLRRRMEADVKSLYALYQYGRLHGVVRLRWGFLEDAVAAPWADDDGTQLYDLMQAATAQGVPLEVVVGTAPGWSEPWARVRRAHVVPDERGWSSELVGDDGLLIPRSEVQSARLAGRGTQA